jgi:hypothetical protein
MLRIFTGLTLVGLTALFAMSYEAGIHPMTTARTVEGRSFGRVIEDKYGNQKFERGHYRKPYVDANGIWQYRDWLPE